MKLSSSQHKTEKEIKYEENHQTSERLSSLLNPPSVAQAKWHAAAYPCQIVENQSFDDLTNPRDDPYNLGRRVSIASYRKLTSLETLAHLLNDKPWVARAHGY